MLYLVIVLYTSLKGLGQLRNHSFLISFWRGGGGGNPSVPPFPSHWLYKPPYLLLTDILTVAQVAVSRIKLFHSTGAGVTRMQLAKVVIASVLILAVHAERLPEGKKCCIIMFTDCVRLHIVAAC